MRDITDARGISSPHEILREGREECGTEDTDDRYGYHDLEEGETRIDYVIREFSLIHKSP